MINRNELPDIQNLWDELADFNAAQSAEALTHLMGRLAAMIGADNAFWVGGVCMAKATLPSGMPNMAGVAGLSAGSIPPRRLTGNPIRPCRSRTRIRI